jgi:hypothetical protein
MDDRDDPEFLKYVIHHVFLPPKLPQEGDHSDRMDSALCKLVVKTAEYFQEILPTNSSASTRWAPVGKMMKKLAETQHSAELLVSSLTQMVVGGQSSPAAAHFRASGPLGMFTYDALIRFHRFP